MKIISQAVKEIVTGMLIAFAIVIIIDAIPLLLGFRPIDAQRFAEAPGLGKVAAFTDGWSRRGKKSGVSEFTVEVDGVKSTITVDGGEVVAINGKPVDDAEDAKETLKEWGF